MDFIIQMSKNIDFKNTISKIKREEILKKYDQELVLRYFAQKNDIENYNSTLSEFLSEFMEKVATNKISFDYKKEQQIFEKTFKFLNTILEKDIFSTLNPSGEVSNNFVIYYFDAFSIGVEKFIEIESFSTDLKENLREKFNSLKNKANPLGGSLYSKRTGSKTNLKKKKEIVEFCLKDLFKKDI